MKLMSVEVRGKEKSWSFNFYGNPKHLEEWRNDDLEINEIVNIVPGWAVDVGLMGVWMFFQDLFNFKFLKR